MKIHEYNEMMSYLTRPAQSIINRENFKDGSSGFRGGIEAQRKGTAASVEAFKAREVDRIRPTFYDGKLDIKGPKKLIDQYKKDFEKRLKFPKGGGEYKKAVSLGEVLSDSDLAKKYNVTIGDVERINRVIKRDLGEYKVPDKKRYMTGKIRREELEPVTDLALEQEYTKLKKGERIGNPDLAHRVSKKYNVTTSNLGLDNPLINRVIVKPNERDISRLYDKRMKIEEKYKLKDGTYKKPSNEDIKALEKINNDVETLARETKGRLSAIVNDPTNLNKPYASLGVDASKTIGAGLIDVNLKDVRKLSPEDQAFLKLNLQELKKRELNKTPKMIADEFKDVLSKPAVRKRIKNIIDKGQMEKPYIKQSKQILALSSAPGLTTADKIKRPDKAKTRDMFKDFEIRTNQLGSNLGLIRGIGETIKAIPTPTGTLALTAGLGVDPASAIDRVALGAEAAFAPELVKQTSRLTSNPLVQRFFNLGLSPQMAMRAARIASPLGIAALAGEGGYQLFKAAQAEQERINQMTPEQRQEFIAEQEDMSRFSANEGGPTDPSKRKFMKIMGGLASLPVLGKFFKIAEPLAPVVSKAAESVPPYFLNLVEKIRALGKSFPGPKDRSESFRYGDYEMDIDYDTGAIDIKKTEQGMFGDEIAPTAEINMSYRPGMADETTGGKPPDEYEEFTVRPDGDGKMKDVEEGVPDDVVDEGSISKEELEQLIIENIKKGE